MREILFRGECKESGAWVYGDLMSGNAICGPSIAQFIKGMRRERHFVRESTIGQYTGSNDMDGNCIFEGDIIKIGGPHGCGAMGVVRIGEYDTLPGGPLLNYGVWVDWFYEPDRHFGMRRQELLFWTKEHRIEVCGNIHDNPELLINAAPCVEP